MTRGGKPMRRLVQRAMAPLAARGPVSTALRRLLLGSHGVVFTLHRFRREGLPVEGIDPVALRALLERLRRERRPLVALRDLASGRWRGDHLGSAVAFTIDDGYADQLEVGVPILLEYDCPVTVFVTTDFVDGFMWMWWDKLEHAVATARVAEATPPAPLPSFPLALASPGARRAALLELVDRLKGYAPAERDALVARFAESVGVELPVQPPPAYAPMTWSAARRAESAGARFGPHTSSHPILSHVSDGESAREIQGSWRRLEDQLADPEPLFCYPNGQRGDFGAREISTLRELGLLGAVTACQGYVSRSRLARDDEYRFTLPRMAYVEDETYLTHVLTGLERVWAALRAGPK